MNKKIMWIPAALLSLTMSQASFADHHGMMSDKMSCPCINMHEATEELNLTAIQKEQIKAIKEQSKSTFEATRQQMQAIRTQMHDLIKSDKIDEAKLTDLVNQKTAMMATMMKEKAMMKNKIYNLLDVKQKEKYAGMMEDRAQNHMKMH